MDWVFFRFVTMHAFDRRTDRRTDGQTDGRTDRQTDRRTDRNLIVKTALHSMQRGKKWNISWRMAEWIWHFHLQRCSKCPPFSRTQAKRRPRHCQWCSCLLRANPECRASSAYCVSSSLFQRSYIGVVKYRISDCSTYSIRILHRKQKISKKQ